jgi:hypothetical protein
VGGCEGDVRVPVWGKARGLIGRLDGLENMRRSLASPSPSSRGPGPGEQGVGVFPDPLGMPHLRVLAFRY